jgi:hypothetical protein
VLQLLLLLLLLLPVFLVDVLLLLHPVAVAGRKPWQQQHLQCSLQDSMPLAGLRWCWLSLTLLPLLAVVLPPPPLLLLLLHQCFCA